MYRLRVVRICMPDRNNKSTGCGQCGRCFAGRHHLYWLERIIENWNRELKFKLCKKSGNPYAPEFMLNRFQNQMNLPPQFFDVSPSYRDYPEVDEKLVYWLRRLCR